MRTQARDRVHCANPKTPTNAGACHVLSVSIFTLVPKNADTPNARPNIHNLNRTPTQESLSRHLLKGESGSGSGCHHLRCFSFGSVIDGERRESVSQSFVVHHQSLPPARLA